MKNKLKKKQSSLQFKISLLFFLVMVVSASISMSLLLLIVSPIMKENSKQQLIEMSTSIDLLESKTNFDTKEIVSIITNSSYSIQVVSKYDDNVANNRAAIEDNGFYVTTDGIIPSATLVTKVRNDFVLVSTFSSNSIYWMVNFIIIIAFIVCIIIGTIITAFVSRTVLQPIRDLSDATSQVARGNFQVRVRVPNDEEYGKLTENFNKMAQELSGIETLRGDFISNVSHEFKTPIASIQGFAKLLQSDNLTKEERNDYTQIIIDETSRLSKLSSNILNLTRLENQLTVGHKTRFSLDEQIRKIILILEPAWSAKNIDMDIDLEEVLYVGNEELMAQVWQNVINNAIKFTPQRGQISVRLFRGAENIIAEIWDNGQSIGDDIKDKIFEKFYQGDKSRATEGNGLGLALVKRVVELSKGNVTVINESKGGVTFRIELPYLIEDML